MLGLDEQVAGLGEGGILVALAVALLLGLRHATDPDHLTAVSNLIASEDGDGAGCARRLGWSWGLGHAVTLFAFGLPVVLFGDALPSAAQRGAELAIGAIVVLLAVRLLVRWREGERPVAHDRTRPGTLGRSPLTAFGIGLVHGAGGSAAAGALIVAAAPDAALRAAALATFAAGTAISMAFATSLFGGLLAGAHRRRPPRAAIPALGALSLAFGVWYALGAVEAVPYLL